MSLPQGDRTPMLDQFMAIKRRHPDAILFYRMGDFYEMFYDDARAASEILGLRLTSRAHGKAAEVPLAGFPYHQLDNYLAKMVKSGRRVVIVEQIEDPKKAKGLVKRDVVRIVTAGTSPAAIDRDDPVSVRIAALIKGRDLWGYSWADLGTGEFCAGEFTDAELVVITAQVDPVEVVIPSSRNDVGPPRVGSQPPVISRVDDWIWEPTFAGQTLESHFNTVGLKGFGISRQPLAISAAGALLHYVKSNLRCDPSHITGLSQARSGGLMYMDPATRRNLELTQSLSGDPRANLFAIVDRTLTTPGRRLLFGRILEPLADIARIEERYEAVEELTHHSELTDEIRTLLKQAGDLQRHLARLATARGSPRDLVAVRETLTLIPKFVRICSNCVSSLIKSLHSRLDQCAPLHKLLQAALNDDTPLNVTEGGVIRDGYDPELDELRNIRRSGRQWLETYEREEREHTGIPNLKVGYNRVFGYYIEITKSHQNKAPADYIRRQTLANAERYTSERLQDYEQKLLSADERILARETEIYNSLVTATLAASPSLQENARVLAELDVQSALAALAQENAYSRPRLTDEPRIVIRGGRHPVVERLLPPGERFIPNDLEIGGASPGIHIITGPNMAGKSTFLRQNALIIILAQAGSFVPADFAEIGIVDRLFTRIGASDNLAGGESTFLVEMQETASILNNATRNSLVLFDEVGRGTSTFDGLSLAWAIVEYLHETPRLKPRTLFATHFHELVDLAKYLDGVANFNVAVREVDEKVLFLRKIIPGGTDRSFGIHVAQMAGLPRSVIDRAREILASLEANDLTINSTPEKVAGTNPPHRHTVQLTLFDPVESKLKERLKSVNPEALTPIDALNLIAELKKISTQ